MKQVIKSRSTRGGRKTKPGNLPNIAGFAIPGPKKRTKCDGTPAEIEGTVELLHEKVRFALFLRANNYELTEIAEEVALRFKCIAPHFSTVSHWLSKYHEAADADCVQFRNRQRQQQGLIIDNLLKFWMPIAIADRLNNQRSRIVEDEEQALLNERTFNEELRATTIVIKLLEREAKLWNLDRMSDEEDLDGVPSEKLGLYILHQLGEQSLAVRQPD
jgi:hypothetical protein